MIRGSVVVAGASAERPGTADIPIGVVGRPLWRRVRPAWLIVALILGAVVVVAWTSSADRLSRGEIAKGGDLAAGALRSGDCFDLKDSSSDLIANVEILPCAEEHEYEMFFVGGLPAGPFPSEDEINAYADENCIGAFEEYVGTRYEDSELEIFLLAPSEAAWNTGDQSIQCAIHHPAIQRLTGSQFGSRR